jgi:hypothetical protein
MLRRAAVLVFLIAAAGIVPRAATAQTSPADGWRVPTRAMPAMPSAAELQGDWMSRLGTWFQGVDGISGVARARLSARGEPAGASPARYVRFSGGPIPVVAWSDRNGDGRADLIEFYRNGTVVLQVVDADFDGSANVVRYHDASGALVREERL